MIGKIISAAAVFTAAAGVTAMKEEHLSRMRGKKNLYQNAVCILKPRENTEIMLLLHLPWAGRAGIPLGTI